MLEGRKIIIATKILAQKIVNGAMQMKRHKLTE